MTAILFVCFANICRSPLAQGIFQHKVDQAGLTDRFRLDSAACGPWYVGQPPDPRSVAVAAKHGISIAHQRARLIAAEDFTNFDLILGMDRDNVRFLMRLLSPYRRAKVALYLEEALGERKDVPDPYGGNEADFERVFELCNRGSDALLQKLA